MTIGKYEGSKFIVDKEKDLDHLASLLLSNMVDKRTDEQYRKTAAQDKIRCAVHHVGIYPDDKYHEEMAVQLFGAGRTRNCDLSTDGISNGKSKWDREFDGQWGRGDGKQTYDTFTFLLQKMTKADKLMRFEILPSNNLPYAWKDEIEMAAKAYHDFYKVWPENWGKPFVPEPTPEPLPEPIIPPVIIIDDEEKPDEPPCTILYHLKRLNFRAAWEHLLGKHSGV